MFHPLMDTIHSRRFLLFITSSGLHLESVESGSEPLVLWQGLPIMQKNSLVSILCVWVLLRRVLAYFAVRV